MIKVSHEMVGHQSVEKTLACILRNYWMPGMQKKVEEYCCNCFSCIMHSCPIGASERNLHMIPKVPVPFDTVHIEDFGVGPCPAVSSKRKHILVIIDAFTKFIRLYPVNSISTKEVICCFEKYFAYYSRPEE